MIIDEVKLQTVMEEDIKRNCGHIKEKAVRNVLKIIGDSNKPMTYAEVQKKTIESTQKHKDIDLFLNWDGAYKVMCYLANGGLLERVGTPTRFKIKKEDVDMLLIDSIKTRAKMKITDEEIKAVYQYFLDNKEPHTISYGNMKKAMHGGPHHTKIALICDCFEEFGIISRHKEKATRPYEYTFLKNVIEFDKLVGIETQGAEAPTEKKEMVWERVDESGEVPREDTPLETIETLTAEIAQKSLKLQNAVNKFVTEATAPIEDEEPTVEESKVFRDFMNIITASENKHFIISMINATKNLMTVAEKEDVMEMVNGWRSE